MKAVDRLSKSQAVALAAVILFTLALLFPMTTTARSGGKSTLCLANLHILGRAWTAYQEDNDGWLVGGSTYFGGSRATPWRWVERPLYNSDDNPSPPPVGKSSPLPSASQFVLEFRLNGIRAGKLYPYTGNTALYHCPSDRRYMEREEPDAGYQSYDISGLMNGEDFMQRSGWPGVISEYRTITLSNGKILRLVCAERTSQIVNPSMKYVFVEEYVALNLQSYNAGGFVLMNANNPDSWWDWPANLHSGEYGPFGFSDGHAQVRNWKDPRTISLIKNVSSPDVSIRQPDNPDLQWMVNGYVPAGW